MPDDPIPAGGGAGRISVNAARDCTWSVAEAVTWIAQLSPSGGRGDGEITFAAAANPSASAREGTVRVNGVAIAIRQEGVDCPVSLSPQSATIGAAGAAGTIAVSAAIGCPWTASSTVPWIVVRTGASGAGNGTITYQVLANAGAARTGTLAIGDATFVVAQHAAGGACSFEVAPLAVHAPPDEGVQRVDVTTGDGCAWTVTSHVPWVTVASPPARTGSATVTLAVAANPDGNRTGTLTVAGRTVSVAQAAAPVACAYTVSPTAQSAGEAGGTGAALVATGDGCPWSASSSAPWLVITSGSSGAGSGTVSYTIAPNPGVARTGTLLIAGRTLTVAQASSCSFAIDPVSLDVSNLGGIGSVRVTAGAACSWTAVSHAPWITVLTSATGSGDGTIALLVGVNLGGRRTGSLTVGGQTLTIVQGN